MRTIQKRNYLEPTEVEERLGITARQVRNWAEKSRFTEPKEGKFRLRTAKDPVSGRIVFLEEDVIEYERKFEASIK